MKTFYCLGTVAVVAATAGAVYTGLPAIATPPAVPPVPVPQSKPGAWVNGEPPALPPIVVDPYWSQIRVSAWADGGVPTAGATSPAVTSATANRACFSFTCRLHLVVWGTRSGSALRSGRF